MLSWDENLLSLDSKTLVFMLVVLTLMLSALLAFARTHSKEIRGLGFWALGNLAISLGMLYVVLHYQGPAWHKILSTALIALGNGFYVNGIQAFLERKPQLSLTAILVLLVGLGDGLFLLNGKNLQMMVFWNALVYLGANLLCAHLLLNTTSKPLGSPYLFTGAVFLLMALLLSLRAAAALLADSTAFEAMAQWSMNKITFIWGSIFQLCTTFGFVLMLNHRMAERLQTLAAHDWLTGALNRRYLEDTAMKLEANCKRANVPLSALLIDFDHFKKINDRYGHQAGDHVLKQAAEMMKSMMRTGDYFGRYGGEEFCVLLPNTGEQDAVELAERIRQGVASKIILYRGYKILCTLSIGVADSAGAGMSYSEIFAAADQCLYEAKQKGRNRVVGYSALQRSRSENHVENTDHHQQTDQENNTDDP